jgi:hypothetical protein
MPSVGATTLAIKAFFHPEQAETVNEMYELHLGQEIIQVHVQDGMLYVQQGQSGKADVIFHTDMRTFMSLFSGQIKPDEAISGGLVQIEGDPQALSRFLKLSSVASPA